jgi:ABC-type transport system involved in cytochrome bd biosynthesis fused ATPase/permease subunit
MEEDAKTRFKWKFYRLTLELNIIILLVAMSIIVFIIIHSLYSVPIIIGMLVVALILSLDFFKKYKDTKKWLDEQPEKDKKDDGTRQNGTI